MAAALEEGPGPLPVPSSFLARLGGGLSRPFFFLNLAQVLLSLCGLPVPKRMQGADLSGVVLDTTDRGPDSAFFQILVPFAGDVTPPPLAGGADGPFHVRPDRGRGMGAYDLADDPYEMKNLAHDPAHGALRERMEARLSAWMERTGDPWTNDSAAPVEDKGRLHRFETLYTIRDSLDWAAKHPDLAPED